MIQGKGGRIESHRDIIHGNVTDGPERGSQPGKHAQSLRSTLTGTGASCLVTDRGHRLHRSVASFNGAVSVGHKARPSSADQAGSVVAPGQVTGMRL